MKLWLKDRIQKAPKHLWADPIANRGNTQWTELAAAFIDEFASERFWLKGAILQGAPQRVQVLFKVGLKHLDANLVDPGSTPVAFDRLKGGAHQCWGDSSREGMNFDLAGNKQFHEWSYHVVLGPS